MKINFLFIFWLFTSYCLFAQSQNNYTNSPHIQVRGEAKKEIVPNEIYLSVVIKERTELREKVNVESQEDAFKAELKIAEIASNELNRQTETEELRSYILKVKTIEQVIQVFAISKKLKLEDVEIVKIGHSELSEYIKNTQIEAINNAKEKATYLLTAIDEQIGKALEVEEGDNSLIISYSISKERNRYDYKGTKSYHTDYLGYIKIKIEVVLKAKFEIVKKS